MTPETKAKLKELAARMRNTEAASRANADAIKAAAALEKSLWAKGDALQTEAARASNAFYEFVSDHADEIAEG
jgi:hypothetical protein